MNNRFMSIAAAMLLGAGSMSAHATIVNETFNGWINFAGDNPFGVGFGDDVTLDVMFDDQDPLIPLGIPGSLPFPLDDGSFSDSSASVRFHIGLFDQTYPSATDSPFPGSALSLLTGTSSVTASDVDLDGFSFFDVFGDGLVVPLFIISMHATEFTIFDDGLGEVVSGCYDLGQVENSCTDPNQIEVVEQPVPEPASLLLLGIGLLGLLSMSRKV